MVKAASSKADFWRGFLPLLLTYSFTVITPQIDVALLARMSGGAPAAYVLLMRIALLELVVLNAMGVVAAVSVAGARNGGGQGETAAQVRGIALAAGGVFGVVGLLIYPAAARAVVGESEIGAFAASAIGWWAAASPLRFLAGVQSASLHALGKGAWVLRWGACEIALKAAGAWLLINVAGLGFASCFISALVVSAVSAAAYHRMLSRAVSLERRAPGAGFSLSFLRLVGWEAQRLLSPQLAVAAALFLFTLPWPGSPVAVRLAPYAAGQMLVLLTLTPLLALTRFLSFRLAGRAQEEVGAVVRGVRTFGAPVVAGVAVILFLGRDWLGVVVYGQQGPWWSWLVAALAISLPVRFAASVMRGVLQGAGRFAETSVADSLAPWIIGLPLAAAGLYMDDPRLAYASLIAPEAVCAIWMWGRAPTLRSSRHMLIRSRPPDLAA